MSSVIPTTPLKVGEEESREDREPHEIPRPTLRDEVSSRIARTDSADFVGRRLLYEFTTRRVVNLRVYRPVGSWTTRRASE
ncbi:MAG: hypothetical protein AABZ61_05510 [Bacteroidota bacterium]